MNPRQQTIAFSTIFRRETIRIARIWPQTLLPPVITQTLYFVIFGKFIGRHISDINGVSYIAFIVPGLVMMAVISNSFTNVVSSFFGTKFQRNVEELLVSPTPNAVIVAGYMAGGMIRGILVGFLVFAVSIFFTHPHIHNIAVVITFIILTSALFSLGGFLNAILAKSFDDISIFPTFVLTPLTYLGGVFYSIHDLPPFWQKISLLNPVLYMVNGFRFGFYGFSDVDIALSILMLAVLCAMLMAVNLRFLNQGTGLKQ